MPAPYLRIIKGGMNGDVGGGDPSATPSQRLAVEHVVSGPEHLICVRGEVDVYTVPLFDAELQRADVAERIIVDLSGCRFIDSSGIAALFRCSRKSADHLRIVVHDQPIVERVFELLRVASIIPVLSSVEDARRKA